MRNSHLNYLALSVPAAALLLCGTSFAQQYTIIDLSTLAGPSTTTGPGSQAYDINNVGDACGVSVSVNDQSDLHGFYWNGALTDLGVLGPDVHSMAFAINAAGNSAGVTFTFGNSSPQAVRWLGTVGAGLGAWTARDMNDGGVIVGEQPTVPSAATTHAVRWTSGNLLDLGTLGGSHSGAYAINNVGRIVGMSFLAGDQLRHAFIWQNGNMLDLGTLGGTSSHAYDISDSGYVVGIAANPSGAQHAFRFTLDVAGSVVTRTDLGSLSGDHSIAYGVNESGDVVGTSNWRAFIWKNGTMTDLNSLVANNYGWELTHATAINDSGQIVGRGKLFGNDRAFRLTPLHPGDVTSDGVVNVSDLLAVIGAWGPCPTPPLACPADVAPPPGGDGVINVSDLLLVINNWG